MKQEEQIKQVYQTPEVGVFETKIKAVICQSMLQEENDGLWS